MTKEELIELSDLNREDNIKYISSEAQGIAITLESDKYAPTLCKLERAYICGRRKSEEQIIELERKLEQTEKDLTDYQFNYPKIKDLEKENTELKEKNGKLLQRIIQLEKDVTENESDCSMCDFPKLKQDLEKENVSLKSMIEQEHKAGNGEFWKSVWGFIKSYADLEKENAVLKEHIEMDCIDCADYIKNKKLEKENAELRKKCLSAQDAVTMQMYTNKANKEIADKKLAEAKDLLDKVLRVVHSELHPYQMQPYLDVLKQAEQFLKEFEIREDRLCEYCDQYKSCPDGKRCHTCDNGSNWKRQSGS